MRDETGVALIMVLLVSTLLLGFGFSLSTNSMFEADIASNHQREQVAFYAAQTGLERAIDGFRTNFTVNNLPADGAVLFNAVNLAVQDVTDLRGDYTVTLARRDSPAGAPIAPFPIHYTITSVGRFLPANANAQPSTATLTQTVAVSPRTLANYTLFYDDFNFEVSFQSSFRLSGRLAVNDPGGVRCARGTTIDGDFYAAGAIAQNASYGIPTVSGNIVQNGGEINFPNTIDTYAAGAAANYTFTGTTRLIFQNNGTVQVHNNSLSGSPSTMSLPANGIIAVTGDAIVEGTISGRCTVTSTDDVLINGGVRYADQSVNSSDTLALVAQNDVILPQYKYTGTTGTTLKSFDASWNTGYYQANSITGGSWGSALTGDFRIDGTLVAINGSSPAVINPTGRSRQELRIFGNSIARKASVTVNSAVTRGLNENYTENKKLDMTPPPGFPLSNNLMPTFFAFREVRTAIR